MTQTRDNCLPSNTETGPRFCKLSVLMPVFNEARTIRTVIRRVLHAPVDIPIELVIVDDSSTDGTRLIIEELAKAEPRIRPVFHTQNQGKAAAIRTAIQIMTGDLALIQDADLEYNPADYPALLDPLLSGIADVVFGSRFLSGPYRRVLYFWHTLANRVLTLFYNILNNINLTDMETGYKVIRADVLRAIPLTSNGFDLEVELATKLAQWDLRIYEVPISYQGRTYVEGKKIGMKDAFSALWALVKYRFFSRRFATHEGFYILQSVRGAKGFNRWLAQQLHPYVRRRVLEAGCGIGNLSEHFLDREQLICVDNDPFYVDRISHRFGHLENVCTHKMDLTAPEDYSAARDTEPDTIICVNVLEHIEDDIGVLRNFYDVLQPNGHLILLVPMHPWLYTGVDRTLGHFRRYTRAELESKFAAVGFEVVKLQGFNRLGSLGWFISGKLFGVKTLSPGQMKLYELLLPIAKLLERIPLLPHLSIIATGRKPAAGQIQPETTRNYGDEMNKVEGMLSRRPNCLLLAHSAVLRVIRKVHKTVQRRETARLCTSRKACPVDVKIGDFMGHRCRLLSIGHSYVVALNRRLVHELGRAGGNDWEVTAVAPSYFRGPRDLRPVSLQYLPDEPCNLVPVPAYLSRQIHVFVYGLQRCAILAQPWDLVHCWEEPFILAGRQVACWKPRKAQLVYATFQNIRKRYPPPFNWIERSSMARASAWIAFGQTTAEALGANPDYRDRASRVIPPGVDLAEFRPDPVAGREVCRALGWAQPGRR